MCVHTCLCVLVFLHMCALLLHMNVHACVHASVCLCVCSLCVCTVCVCSVCVCLSPPVIPSRPLNSWTLTGAMIPQSFGFDSHCSSISWCRGFSYRVLFRWVYCQWVPFLKICSSIKWNFWTYLLQCFGYVYIAFSFPFLPPLISSSLFSSWYCIHFHYIGAEL